MKPVAILGSGPASLLAAYAVGLSGKPIAIFSQGQKSVIGGAQFLHMAIPELTSAEPDATITYEVHGDEAIYRQKVYGMMPVPFTSFGGVQDGMTQPAWHMQGAYERLWMEFKDSMNDAQVSPAWVDENAGNFQAIISGIPRPALCRSMHGEGAQRHDFLSQKIRIADHCILDGLKDNTVRYEGTRDFSWYRCSKLFGHGGTEWTDTMHPPMETVEVTKPIRALCDCFPEIIRVGRYGKWAKGVLIHDGFTTSLRELNERGIINIGPKKGGD